MICLTCCKYRKGKRGFTEGSGKMKNKKLVSIMFIILDIILLVLFVLFIPNLLWHIVGPDFIEYENWSGELSNTIGYRFGAGSCELSFILLRMIIFIILQIKLLKDQSKVRKIWPVLIHIIIGVLGLIYFFKFAEGPNMIYNLQLIFDN